VVDIAFEVVSDTEDGSDITPSMLRQALLLRIIFLDRDNGWKEATSICDSYEIELETA
tara:strand:+ start:636 stop:809 length:174 start_codon:yes stop_codon:yes gene_type:complete